MHCIFILLKHARYLKQIVNQILQIIFNTLYLAGIGLKRVALYETYQKPRPGIFPFENLVLCSFLARRFKQIKCSSLVFAYSHCLLRGTIYSFFFQSGKMWKYEPFKVICRDRRLRWVNAKTVSNINLQKPDPTKVYQLFLSF